MPRTLETQCTTFRFTDGKGVKDVQVTREDGPPAPIAPDAEQQSVEWDQPDYKGTIRFIEHNGVSDGQGGYWVERTFEYYALCRGRAMPNSRTGTRVAANGRTESILQRVHPRMETPAFNASLAWRENKVDHATNRRLFDAESIRHLRLAEGIGAAGSEPEKPLTPFPNPSPSAAGTGADEPEHPLIPLPSPSAPMSKKNAADAWGGDMTEKKLTGFMASGKVRYKELNRETFIFCLDDMPGFGQRR
jgi:hypothetical protein